MDWVEIIINIDQEVVVTSQITHITGHIIIVLILIIVQQLILRLSHITTLTQQPGI